MSGLVVFLARCVLGGVFVASGLLKARDPLWPRGARAFGAPGWMVPVLPWMEVALGALLGAQVWLAGVAAVVVLATFTVAVGWHLARGHRVACACFGARSSRPVGPGTIVRNLVLVLLAVVALF